MRYFLSFCLSVVFLNHSYSQQLLLKSGTIDVDDLTEEIILMEGENLVDGYYFRILVFSEIPSDKIKSELQSDGIILMDYLPQNAFFAAIPADLNTDILTADMFLKVIPVKSSYKTSEMLTRNEIPHWSLFGTDQVELIASYYDVLSDSIVAALLPANMVILGSNPHQHSFILRLNIADLPDLYNMTCFRYFEVTDPPGEPENLPGRTDHRSNTLWTNYAGGLTYRGDGIKVMMQDDGYIGAHIDYTGRIDQSACSNCSTDDLDNHGDHVGGTIMGAGNLNPRYRGMAHGAELLVYNSNNSNYNVVPNLYQNDSVCITSKSYSNTCNGGYTSLTQQLDQQIKDYPSLIHVFSAGNNGTSDCGYGAGAGWGNITGGHKSGKNVIAVGNLSATDDLNSSSSRGPATDGRIKPDICGVGTGVNSTVSVNNYANFTGTSMSCPGVAGTIAQLYDGYRSINSGENPNSALIKASIMNTADDLGNTGPDFKHGWGRINARRAFDLIENSLYLTDTITQGALNTHNITVPGGTKEVRIMLYWADYQGSTSASIALVNDLNMVVTDPNLIDYNPWVLDPSPNATALNTPATTGVDNLNNVEQVVITDPASGVYTISIDGFAIPQGPQNYYIVYYFLADEITVTYPIGGEGLEPQTSEIIRWDAVEGTDPFTISFSEDDGASWTTLGTAAANQRHYSWFIPQNTLTGLGRIKVERGSAADSSDAVFSVIDIPNNLTVDWACPDSLKLIWDSVPGALSYEVSMLGNKYMDSIGNSILTSFTAPIPSTTNTWFSVKALGPDGAVGERAIAINKTPGEFGCLWSTPYATFSTNCEEAGVNYCFGLNDESINTDSNSSFTWYFPGGSPSVSNDQFPVVCYNTPGDYDVAMVVDNGAGSDSIYMANVFHVITSPSLPYFEGFENYTSFFGLDEWSVDNPDGNAAFSITSAASLSGVKSTRLMNYGQNGNFTDELISGPLDLGSLNPSSDTITMSFRYAYRKRSSSNDEWLKVYVKSGCTEAWVQRKTLHGDMLSNQVVTTSWSPSQESDWTTVHMTNITSNFFTSDFRMKFRFESDNGNNFYLDNINIYQGAPSDDLVLSGLEEINLSEVTVYPNPTDGEVNISFDQLAAGQVTVHVKDLSGKIVFERSISGNSGNNLIVIDGSHFSSGLYFVSLQQGNASVTEKLIVK